MNLVIFREFLVVVVFTSLLKEEVQDGMFLSPRKLVPNARVQLPALYRRYYLIIDVPVL